MATMDKRLATRSVLLFGIVMGGITLLYQFVLLDLGVGGDFNAYYLGTRSWMAGETVYGRALDSSSETLYLYAPVTLILFSPFTFLPTWLSAFIAFTVVQIASGLVLANMLVNFLRERDTIITTFDRVLIVLFVIGSSITVGGIRNGNINIILSTFIAGAVVLLYDGEEISAAASLAIASLFKIFLAFFGIWFLIKKSKRAAGGSVIVGLTGLTVGLTLGVNRTISYVRFIIGHGRMEIAPGGIAPETEGVSVLRPLSQIFPFGFIPLAIVSSLLLLGLIGYLASETDDDVGDLYLILWIVITPTIIYFPEYSEFLLFPLLALLYLVEDTTEFLLLASGSILVITKIGYGQYSTVISLVGEGQMTTTLLIFGKIVFSIASLPLYGIGLFLLAALYHSSRETEESKLDESAETVV